MKRDSQKKREALWNLMFPGRTRVLFRDAASQRNIGFLALPNVPALGEVAVRASGKSFIVVGMENRSDGSVVVDVAPRLEC